MADCIPNEEYSGYATSTFLVGADVVQAFHARPLCRPDITIRCDKLTPDEIQNLAACQRDVREGRAVLPKCMTQTHPAVLGALEAQCPDVYRQLPALPGPPQPPAPTPQTANLMSTGAVWGLVAAGVAAFAWVAYSSGRRRRR